MENLQNNPTFLDLSISVPGFASSSSSGGKREGSNIMRRDFDINEVPSEEQWTNIIVGGSEGEEESITTTIPTGISTENEGGGSLTKKLRLTAEQSRMLEENFKQNYTINHVLMQKQKEELAEKLMLKPRQVEVWFQNRRARNKLKHTEMEYEFLKRHFESLTEENKKLYKEVEELRAMRAGSTTTFSLHGREHFLPPMIMCARCKCVTTTITTPHGNRVNSRPPSTTC